MVSSMTIAAPMADISIFEGRTTCLIDLCSSLLPQHCCWEHATSRSRKSLVCGNKLVTRRERDGCLGPRRHRLQCHATA